MHHNKKLWAVRIALIARREYATIYGYNGTKFSQMVHIYNLFALGLCLYECGVNMAVFFSVVGTFSGDFFFLSFSFPLSRPLFCHFWLTAGCCGILFEEITFVQHHIYI